MLKIEILEDGLNDHVHPLEVRVVDGGDQVGHVLLPVQLGNLLPLHLLVDPTLNLQTGLYHYHYITEKT